jgi:mitochondrial transcription factor 1
MKTLLDSSQAAELTKQLSKWVTSQSPKAPARKGGRTQIVSPSLCHDTLQRLGPSLKPHYGCDLIDINPGICLWSRHLHDVLKPRRHILVEPERKAFDGYITPLIEENPELYVHTTTLSDALDASNGFLSEHLLKQNTVAPLASNAHQLLITANLTGHLDAKYWFGTTAGHFFNDFCGSFWSMHSEMHRYGLIRVLAWTPDAYKSEVAPRTVEQRGRKSILLETMASVSEIASTGWNRVPGAYVHDQVWPGLVKEAADAVQVKQTAAGVKSPQDRFDAPPWAPQWAVPPDPQVLRSSPTASHMSKTQELLRLDDRLGTEAPDWHKKALRAVAMDVNGPKAKFPANTTPEQKAWRTQMSHKRTIYKTYLDTAKIVKRQRSLDQRWRSLLLQIQGGALDAETLTRLEDEAKIVLGATDDLPESSKAIARRTIDDYRAYDSRPQALAWNKRQFEPLLVQPKEFAPDTPLALFDITPSPEFRQTLPNYEQCEMFDYIITRLCGIDILPTTNVQAALTQLLGAGVDEFLETCPSLKDPVQGGWYDLSQLRLRSLPPKLFLDIALAWEKWPFRRNWTQVLLERRSISPFEEPL